MFFARLAVAALSLGVAFAAPVKIADPNIGDVALPAGVPAMVPRTISAVQLATNMVKLEDCIDGANTAISKAQGALPLVDITNTLLALKQVGEKLQSVKNSSSIKGVGSQLAPIKVSVDRMVTVIADKAQGVGLDEIHSLAVPLLSLFTPSP
ncbi:hypothetical protein RSAG8_03055, partial [Rhizoctonia solani AG-8 WAC10335]